MDIMNGDAIDLLLETFQELRRRGDQARLFLETRNGEQYGTLHIKSPTKPATHKTTMKKSPSTVRRDQQRWKTFLQRKTLQESPGRPLATSTPGENVRVALPRTKENLLLDSQGKPSTASSSIRPGWVAMPQTNKILDDDSTNKTIPDERALEKHTTEKANDEINDAEKPLMTFEEIKQQTTTACEKIFSKYNWYKKTDEKIEDRNIGEPADVKEDNSDDNIESAKKWAIQQKQSLIK